MNFLKLSYDWDPVFRRVMLGTMLLCIFPADLYMRFLASNSLGPAAFLLLPALLAYFIPFLLDKKPHLRPLFFGLIVLNIVCMILGFKEFFYEYLQPLVINTGSIGFIYSTIYQILFFFASAYHSWVWVLLKKK